MGGFSWRAATAAGAGLVFVITGFVPVAAQAVAPKTLFVSQGGFDSGSCPSTSPCATVSYALTKAASGATINVSGVIIDHPTVTSPVTITRWRGGPAGSRAVLNGAASGAVVTITGIGVTLRNLTIENGSGGFAGGVFNEEGTVKIIDSTVSGNAGGNSGGGIGNYGGGTMTVIDSTITRNSDPSQGAGISNTGTLTVIASTISGNTGGGIYSGQGRVATLGATIVAGNTGGNCLGYDAGSLVSAGYNLTSDKTRKACGFTALSDRVNARPGLGHLANNGGPTKTLLPAAGGPADDIVPQTTTLRGVAVCPAIDQRGATRPARGEARCTIGAVEV